MKTNVGVWIDHKKAVIVSATNGEEKTQTILSGMEGHTRHSGEIPEDQQERRFTNHLNEYYTKVILSLHDADSILILGPGEAKGELKTRLEFEALGGRIAGIETVDKMTDRQVASTVREHFLAKPRSTN